MAASAPAFSPLSLSPTLWVKADAISGVTTDGTAVSSWTDQSGNNNHLLQAGAGLKPLFKTGIQNGLPGILFDGLQTFMKSAAWTALPQPTTVLLVSAMSAGPGAAFYFDGIASGNRNAFGAQFVTGGNHEVFGGANVVGAAQSRPTGSNVWTVVFNGASSSARKNGAAFASGATNIGSNALTGLTVGSDNAGATGFLGGYLFETVVVNRLLTGTEQTNIEAYLKAKWGTA